MSDQKSFWIKKPVVFLLISVFPALILPKEIMAASLSLAVKNPEIAASSEFQTEILLDTQGEETLGTDVIISYDPIKLEALKAIPGDLYPNYPGAGKRIDQNEGKVYLSGVANYGTPISTSGVFGTVEFKAKQAGQVTLSLEWEKGKTNLTSVVPHQGNFDLLTEKPRALHLSIKEKSFWEKLTGLIELIRSFLKHYAFW